MENIKSQENLTMSKLLGFAKYKQIPRQIDYLETRRYQCIKIKPP